MKKVAIIGGGAAGMMAAVTAAKCGAKVTIYEKNDRVGKKILATGNGKCNFSNRDFSTAYYNGGKEKLPHYFKEFGVEETVGFFKGLGMLVKEKKGYLYPLSEQSSTVLDILRMEIDRRKIEVRVSEKVHKIKKNTVKGNGSNAVREKITVITEVGGREVSLEYDAVIIACGGCAAPATGSSGDGYLFAKALGHRMIPVVPALVQLRCSNDFFKMIAGVRCEALLKLYSGEVFLQQDASVFADVTTSQVRLLQEEQGELQFTDYGISGIPVFQFSRQAAYELRKKKKVTVVIDLLPEIEENEWKEIVCRRIKETSGKTMEEFLLGVANKKLNLLMIKLAGLKPAADAEEAGKKTLKKLLYSYKKLCVHVISANPFENAQVTAGGVDMKEVTEKLESVKAAGVYFAGEVLDIDGRCGGYNLQWAWTSGYLAGKNAAAEKNRGSGSRETKIR